MPHLRDLGVVPRTLFLYRKSLTAFLGHLRLSGKRLPTNGPELDEEAAKYINLLYQEGDGLTQAGYLLSSLKRFVPSCKRDLFISKQYFVNWSRLQMPSRATPFTWPLLRAMASACLKIGRLDLAAGLFIGFSCFLRTGEMLSLSVGDVQIFKSGVFVVRLASTKTTSRKRAIWSQYILVMPDCRAFCRHCCPAVIAMSP